MFEEPQKPDDFKNTPISERPMQVVQEYLRNEKNPVVEMEREGLSWKTVLSAQKKPFLEIAGPTFHGKFDIINFKNYSDRLIVTNIDSSAEITGDKDEKIKRSDMIDAVMDGDKLGIRDGALGAVFISSFRIRDENRKRPKPKEHKPDLENAERIEKVAKEAWRVMDEGGMLVWLSLETREELQTIEDTGFIPVFSQDVYFKKIDAHRYQMVYIKESKKTQG